MIRMLIVCSRLIDPGVMRRLYQTRQHAGDARHEGRQAEGEQAVQGHVEAERAHAGRLVAEALEAEPNAVRVARARSQMNTSTAATSVTK